MKLSSSKIFIQLVSVISEEDKDLLEENSENEEMTRGVLNALYQKYHGQTTDQAIEELQEEFAQVFLDGLDKDVSV
jgi:hypothetical protein